MALSPIQIFSKGNENSLQAILAGGNNVITGIMNQAIQTGRDISNKQLAQERDMLGMRAQETALAQRRVENRQQDYEDAKNFTRRAFETDRRYAADQQNTSFTQNRTTAQDIFGNQLATNQDSRAQQGLDLQEGGLKLRQDQAERERLTGEEVTRRNLELANTEPTSAASAKTIFDANVKVGDPAGINRAGENVTKFTPPKAGSKAGDAPFTPAEKAASDFDTDTGAFPRHTQVMLDRAKVSGQSASDLKKTDPYKAAAERDKLGVQAEYLAASRMEEDEYANYGGMRLTPAQVEMRRNVWKVANGKTSGASTPTGAVSQIPGI